MGIGNKRGLELFTRAGALLDGHFRLQSGKDGINYVAKDLLRENDDEAMREICLGIADDFAGYNIETVVGPESGAVKYAEYVAEFLSKMTGKKVVAVRARKCDGGEKKFYFTEDDIQYHIHNRRVLIVEDVFTTGESAAKVVKLTEEHFGIVVAVGGVWNRGAVTAVDLGVVVFISQINQQYPTFEPGETCPGCCSKIPYDLKWGHGKNLIKETQPA